MQLNPHFVFNSLNAINYYILRHESEQASTYLTKFSKLIRQAMLNTATEWIPLRNELTALQTYIDLELLRSNNAFEMILNISESLNPDDICIPPMIMYPYVENAIRHGLLQQPITKPVLRINCSAEKGYLLIQIADNGIGRAASMQAQRNGLTAHKSYGHTITTERLQLINDLYGSDSRVDFTDLITNTGTSAGTCVTFSMKLKSC
ncbi:histidine kinase [Spirosoma sp. BT704]|uniref:Histidine kinase n=2 Tax=Spirosoma validum TaxID=2771355 RepID=A0A927B1L9_9BACT|nr:histidine kinase [Spirosoma validum]